MLMISGMARVGAERAREEVTREGRRANGAVRMVSLAVSRADMVRREASRAG